MLVLDTTDAVGNGLTVIVTEFDFTHPFKLVSVSVQVVVEEGNMEGFAIVEVNPAGELIHE